jgi:hypothetical protein
MNPLSMAPMRINIPDRAPKIVKKEHVPDARALAIVPLRAFKDRTLTAGQFRALGIVCSYANRAGLLWAGLERMGKDLGISTVAMHKYCKQLEAKGYLRTVYKGFAGERANTRQIVYNQEASMNQIIKQTGAEAPFMAEKREKQASKKRKQLERSREKASDNTINSVEVKQTAMQSVHDVMQLKNKVSDKIWQLAIQRANSETDYAAIKAAIDKLLR